MRSARFELRWSALRWSLLRDVNAKLMASAVAAALGVVVAAGPTGVVDIRTAVWRDATDE